MEKDRIQELLYQKMEFLQKKLNRTYLLLYVFPLIFFLLKYSIIEEVTTPLISIKQKDFIFTIFPLIYISLILLIVILSQRLLKIEYQFEINNSAINKEIKELLSPIAIITEITQQNFPKNFIGLLGTIILYLPLIVFTLLFPLLFFFYTIYLNLKNENNFILLALISNVVSLWILLILIVNLYFLFKETIIVKAKS